MNAMTQKRMHVQLIHVHSICWLYGKCMCYHDIATRIVAIFILKGHCQLSFRGCVLSVGKTNATSICNTSHYFLISATLRYRKRVIFVICVWARGALNKLCSVLDKFGVLWRLKSLIQRFWKVLDCVENQDMRWTHRVWFKCNEGEKLLVQLLHLLHLILRVSFGFRFDKFLKPDMAFSNLAMLIGYFVGVELWELPS